MINRFLVFRSLLSGRLRISESNYRRAHAQLEREMALMAFPKMNQQLRDHRSRRILWIVL